MEYPEITKANIWNFRQNNLELIIQDAKKYLGMNKEQCETLQKILLARGVNKWLKVRRDLIAYKKQLKHKVKEVEEQRKFCKGTIQYKILREVSKTLQEVRAVLRGLCKTNRWQIWPTLGSHHKELKTMNNITASGN